MTAEERRPRLPGSRELRPRPLLAELWLSAPARLSQRVKDHVEIVEKELLPLHVGPPSLTQVCTPQPPESESLSVSQALLLCSQLAPPTAPLP